MKKRAMLIGVSFFIICITTAQVTQINSNNSLSFTYPLSNTKSVFVSGDQHLWVTDGTLAGTLPLSADITYVKDLGGTGFLNGMFMFAGNTPATGTELYITDGTPAGTVLLKDIYPGANSSSPGDDASLLNGFIYFTAETAAQGRELWRTNGTAAGTTLVKDIVPGSASSNYPGGYNLFSNGSYLLFMANTPSSGVELWRSDGTDAGTVLLKDINPGPDSSGVEFFTRFNNLVLFTANDGVHGVETWKSDGTPAGTLLLKDINPGSSGSESFLGFTQYFIFNNHAFFTADDGTNGNAIWSTDGTSANTFLLKDLEPGPDNSLDLLGDAIINGNKFFFPSTNFTGTRFQIWQSDGTSAGTTLFQDFPGGTTPILFPAYSINATTLTLTQNLYQGNKFFFVASTPAQGSELWISDGTVANTHIVKDINPGAADGLGGSSLSFLYTSAGLYFAGTTATSGTELWKSDGTDAGTTQVADIVTGEQGSDPSLVEFLVNGKILFQANNGDSLTATDLYAVDGNFTPLPIQLISFGVMPRGADALLQWYTSQELNSKNFTVQRSFDGVSFKDITTVAAAGNSSTRRAYAYTDAGVINSGNSVVYYRLLSADIDGKTTLSPVVKLKLKEFPWNVRLLANPIVGDVNVLLTGVTGKVNIAINDLSGKLLYSDKQVAANAPITISGNHFPHGIYFLTITNGTQKKAVRFIK